MNNRPNFHQVLSDLTQNFQLTLDHIINDYYGDNDPVINAIYDNLVDGDSLEKSIQNTIAKAIKNRDITKEDLDKFNQENPMVEGFLCSYTDTPNVPLNLHKNYDI